MKRYFCALSYLQNSELWYMIENREEGGRYDIF